MGQFSQGEQLVNELDGKALEPDKIDATKNEIADKLGVKANDDVDKWKNTLAKGAVLGEINGVKNEMGLDANKATVDDGIGKLKGVFDSLFDDDPDAGTLADFSKGLSDLLISAEAVMMTDFEKRKSDIPSADEFCNMEIATEFTEFYDLSENLQSSVHTSINKTMTDFYDTKIKSLVELVSDDSKSISERIVALNKYDFLMNTDFQVLYNNASSLIKDTYYFQSKAETFDLIPDDNLASASQATKLKDTKWIELTDKLTKPDANVEDIILEWKNFQNELLIAYISDKAGIPIEEINSVFSKEYDSGKYSTTYTEDEKKVIQKISNVINSNDAGLNGRVEINCLATADKIKFRKDINPEFIDIAEKWISTYDSLDKYGKRNFQLGSYYYDKIKLLANDPDKFKADPENMEDWSNSIGNILLAFKRADELKNQLGEIKGADFSYKTDIGADVRRSGLMLSIREDKEVVTPDISSPLAGMPTSNPDISSPLAGMPTSKPKSSEESISAKKPLTSTEFIESYFSTEKPFKDLKNSEKWVLINSLLENDKDILKGNLNDIVKDYKFSENFTIPMQIVLLRANGNDYEAKGLEDEYLNTTTYLDVMRSGVDYSNLPIGSDYIENNSRSAFNNAGDDSISQLYDALEYQENVKKDTVSVARTVRIFVAENSEYSDNKESLIKSTIDKIDSAYADNPSADLLLERFLLMQNSVKEKYDAYNYISSISKKSNNSQIIVDAIDLIIDKLPLQQNSLYELVTPLYENGNVRADLNYFKWLVGRNNVDKVMDLLTSDKRKGFDDEGKGSVKGSAKRCLDFYFKYLDGKVDSKVKTEFSAYGMTDSSGKYHDYEYYSGNMGAITSLDQRTILKNLGVSIDDIRKFMESLEISNNDKLRIPLPLE